MANKHVLCIFRNHVHGLPAVNTVDLSVNPVLLFPKSSEMVFQIFWFCIHNFYKKTGYFLGWLDQCIRYIKNTVYSHPHSSLYWLYRNIFRPSKHPRASKVLFWRVVDWLGTGIFFSTFFINYFFSKTRCWDTSKPKNTSKK